MNVIKSGSTETTFLEKPQPKVDAILRIQGYKDLSRIRKRVRDAADAAANLLTEIAEPTVSYRIVRIESLIDDTLTLERETCLESPIFTQYLSDAHEVVVFALTMGKEVDERTIELMESENLVEALFLESAAWLGVEHATKQFVIAVRAWASSNGKRITRRLGPGYSYPIDGQPVVWDLTDQNKLFDVFDDAQIPVRLLESSAMLPKMSRSGMYGLIDR